MGNALIFASIVKSSSVKGGTVCMGDSGIKRTMANNRLALNCKACEIFREEMSQKYNPYLSQQKTSLNDRINQELGSYPEVSALF